MYFRLEGHDGTVSSLTLTAMYVVSCGMDDRLCIWERIRGHLLHWIQMEPGYCNRYLVIYIPCRKSRNGRINYHVQGRVFQLSAGARRCADIM